MPENQIVSVIMNCYNGEKYLREALDSILAQTYKNWELIFWDNQSTDKSVEIFKSYADERLKYFYAPTHTLLYEARNYAIEKASGEFYAFIDVDDWWEKEKLEKQILLFEDQEVGLVYSNHFYKNELKGTRIVLYKRQLPSGRILNELLNHYVVGLLTIVVRRTAIENLDHSFDPRFHVIGDFDLVIRLANKCKFNCIQSPLATCRWHGENESTKQKVLHLREMGKWLNEMNKNNSISSLDGFRKTEKLYQYMKGMNWIEQANIIETLKVIWAIPFGKEKIKLLLALIMPSPLLKTLRR